MPQPYADADLSELLAAKVTVLSAAERIHPDSNAFTQTFNREKTLSDDFRRYQSQAIKYYLEKRYDAQSIRLTVQFDRTTVVATFVKGW